MTSKAVTQTDFYSQNVTNKNQKARQPNDSQNSFGHWMNQTVTSQKESPLKSETTKRAEKPQAVHKDEPSKVKPKETQKQEEKPEVDIKELEDKISAKTEEIQKEIAEELGVSQEDVEKAMEALGMQNMDLLDPNMLANLLVELSGETDILALVTNEDLYASLNNLLQTVDSVLGELQKECCATPEEMQQLLENLKANPQTGETGKVPEQTIPSTTETVVDKIPEEGIPKEGISEEPLQEGKIPEESNSEMTSADKKTEKLPITKETMEKPVTLDNEEPVKPLAEPIQKQAGNGSGTENSAKQGNELAKEGIMQTGKEETKETTPNILQNFSNQLSAKLDEALQNVKNPVEAQDTERIMRQVMDNMKIHIGGNVTEMEMQLHPASLGTVNLHVAYKEGALTAQFTAQNETVKAAIESQIVQLRENLNNQGVKVEAIEVTIASHEFERNLSQGNGDNSPAEQSDKRGQRKINLGDMDAFEETDLGEAEKIAVQLMKENGNTVDFTA